MQALTIRQRQIWEYLRNYVLEHGYPPSFREVAGHFKINLGTAQDHLKALVRKGYLKREPHRSRGVSLVRSSGPLRTIPLYGAVPAGRPLLIEEDAEDFVTLPEGWAKGEEVFLLRVRGESMSPYILPGDQVIVRRQEQISVGEIGVFRLENEVTLKRYYQSENRVILKGDNPEIEPLIMNQEALSAFSILGKVIGIYRSLNN